MTDGGFLTKNNLYTKEPTVDTITKREKWHTSLQAEGVNVYVVTDVKFIPNQVRIESITFSCKADDTEFNSTVDFGDNFTMKDGSYFSFMPKLLTKLIAKAIAAGMDIERIKSKCV